MNYLLIDGNSITHASQDGNKLTVGDVEVQAIYNTLRTIRSIVKSSGGYRPIVLWDGRAQFRYDIYPRYKESREEVKDERVAANREAVRNQRPEIQRALSFLGVRQIKDKNAEADDLAAYFSSKLSLHGKVKLITGDRDWIQLVTPDVEWHDHRNERSCTFNTFEEFTGCKDAQQFVDLKCLVGDNSDFIPGVGGIGEKGAKELLLAYGSVSNFFEAMQVPGAMSEKMPKAWLNLALNVVPKASSKYGEMLPMKEAYERNRKLMKLGDYVPRNSSLETNNGSFDRAEFESFCKEFLFKSILVQMDTWIKPFQILGESK